jgi:hypothetical protein
MLDGLDIDEMKEQATAYPSAKSVGRVAANQNAHIAPVGNAKTPLPIVNIDVCVVFFSVTKYNISFSISSLCQQVCPKVPVRSTGKLLVIENWNPCVIHAVLPLPNPSSTSHPYLPAPPLHWHNYRIIVPWVTLTRCYRSSKTRMSFETC